MTGVQALLAHIVSILLDTPRLQQDAHAPKYGKPTTLWTHPCTAQRLSALGGGDSSSLATPLQHQTTNQRRGPRQEPGLAAVKAAILMTPFRTSRLRMPEWPHKARSWDFGQTIMRHGRGDDSTWSGRRALCRGRQLDARAECARASLPTLSGGPEEKATAYRSRWFGTDQLLPHRVNGSEPH